MAAITGSVIALGTTAYSIAQSSKAKKDAKEAIEEFDRQDLKNPYKDVRISTLKSDQQTDANLSNFATSVEALQSGGTRTTLAGLPKLSESNILLQNIISSDLEKQAIERDYAIAQGEERNQAVMERREENALLGLGQQYQTARQDQATGFSNLASAGLSLGSAINYNNSNRSQPQQNSNLGGTLNDTSATTNVSNVSSGMTTPSRLPAPSPYNLVDDPFGFDNASVFNNNPSIFNV